MFKNKILNIIVSLSLIVLFFIVLGFTIVERNDTIIDTPTVLFKDTEQFIDKTDVLSELSALGYNFIDKQSEFIDIALIETSLNSLNEIKNVDVYKTVDNKLFIEICQRVPLVRIYNKKNGGYYLDQQGKVMYLSNKYTSLVTIATGFFDVKPSLKRDVSEYDSSSYLDDLYVIMKVIDNDSFLKAQISQINVDKKGNFTLIPRVGMHTIIFGKAVNVKEKFNNLYLFYKKGLKKDEWNNYDTIKLQYKNQIVCTTRKYY